MQSFLYTLHIIYRVPTKIRKHDSMTFPWLICFFPWLAFSHGFRYGYDCVSQHARQSQTRKLPQPWEEAIPWLFRKFSYSKTFPWLSMTTIFSRIFHDRGNPAYSPACQFTRGSPAGTVYFKVKCAYVRIYNTFLSCMESRGSRAVLMQSGKVVAEAIIHRWKRKWGDGQKKEPNLHQATGSTTLKFGTN